MLLNNKLELLADKPEFIEKSGKVSDSGFIGNCYSVKTSNYQKLICRIGFNVFCCILQSGLFIDQANGTVRIDWFGTDYCGYSGGR